MLKYLRWAKRSTLIVLLPLGVMYYFIVPVCGCSQMNKKAGAKGQIESFSTALDTFRIDLGRYPTNEENLAALIDREALMPTSRSRWRGPYLRKIPKDPWGNKYTYQWTASSDNYEIVSYGSDGKIGGVGDAKDITTERDVVGDR